MKLGGFRKKIIEYVICVTVLILGVIMGVLRLGQVRDDSRDYFAGKRVDFAQHIPAISEGSFNSVPESFFISTRNANEQSVIVKEVHGAVSVREGTVIAVDLLFQEESGFFRDEYDGHGAGSLTFLTVKSDEEAFLTFLFDLSEYEKLRTDSIVRNCVCPVVIAIVIVMIILALSLVKMRRNLFGPIVRISELSKHICNGDYEQNYLEVNSIRGNEDEVSELVCSFEMMRDELKAKQELADRLSKSERELVSCMSHDLQTPLSTIKAYCEGIRDNIARSEEDKQKYLEVILRKTNTMIDMIRDLLTYSNAQLGELPMEFFDIMSNEFFYPLMLELKNYAKQKEVMLDYELDEMDVLLHIDPKRMTQLMYNLVENSMKYMDKVDMRIAISAKHQGDCFKIKVEDNGMGIKAEEILHIFDKFYRAEKSRSSSVPGAGLGLSICKYIAEQHGGEIWCDSKYGEGTVFCVMLPIR